MTKAKKGLIITLFAAMMVFAFGATSAFAIEGESVEWQGNCDVLVYTDANGVETPYTEINKVQGSDGLWCATVNTDEYSSGSELPDIVKNAEGYFWDLKDAKLGYTMGRQGEMKTLPSTFTKREDFESIFMTTNAAGVKEFVEIRGAAAAVKTATGYAPIAPMAGTTHDVDANKYRGWYGVLAGYDAYDPDNKEAQTVTLSYDEKYYREGVHEGTQNNPFVFNADLTKTVSIPAYVPTVNDIKLYYDDEDTPFSEEGGVMYNGAAHKIVTNDVEGFSVSYKVYESGAWKDAQEVTVTNVNEDVKFQVVVKDSKGAVVSPLPTTLSGTKTAKVTCVNNIGWGFGFVTTGFASTLDNQGTAYGTKYVSEYYLPGSEYNPADYFDVAAGSGDSAAATAAAAAIEANKTELMNFFNDCFVIDATAAKFDSDTVKLSIKAKDDLKDKKVLKAMAEKYKVLGTNFNFNWNSATTLSGSIASSQYNDNVVPTATLYLNDVSLDDEVLFTEAPDMTYHVKKAKKLKKTKSFTVAAVAASGKVVSYKMDSSSKKITIDSATGKITVKKGIKKGTYKVKVIAQTTKGDGYRAKSAVRYLQIKVKK